MVKLSVSILAGPGFSLRSGHILPHDGARRAYEEAKETVDEATKDSAHEAAKSENAVVLLYEQFHEEISRRGLFAEPLVAIATGMILTGFLIYAFAGRAVRSVTSWWAILDFAIGYCPITAAQILYFLYFD